MTELEIIPCEQGSLDWHQARLGVFTASTFGVLFKKGRGPGGVSQERGTLMRRLAGERITGQLPEVVNSIYTERGHAIEPEARDFYTMLTDTEPTQIGFLRRGGVGCSPDSLVGEDGLLELKSRDPAHQIEVLLTGELPEEHRAQCQGQLWVSARRWCDYLSYCPGLPPFLVRVERDETYIATLAIAAAEFLAELDAMVETIRGYDFTTHYKVAA